MFTLFACLLRDLFAVPLGDEKGFRTSLWIILLLLACMAHLHGVEVYWAERCARHFCNWIEGIAQVITTRSVACYLRYACCNY